MNCCARACGARPERAKDGLRPEAKIRGAIAAPGSDAVNPAALIRPLGLCALTCLRRTTARFQFNRRHTVMRYSVGVAPVQRRNALVKLAGSEKPSRYDTSANDMRGLRT